MARSIIGSRWTPLQRNELNRMLTELYDAVGFITEGTITPEMIANGSITGSKIAAGSIYGDKIANNSIEDGKLMEKTVGNRELKDGSILNSKYATRSISWDKLEEGAVTDSRIADGAVKNSKIADGAVSVDKTNFDTLSLNKGKVFPFENRGTEENGRFNNGFLDIKVHHAQEGAIYRVSHVSKDNTAWGAAVTYFEIGRSVDDGTTWQVLIARGNLNLPNNQSGVKTHTLTLNNIDEIFVLAVDWRGFATGSNNLGIYDYIISPINYNYVSETEEVNVPPYLKNKGITYPFENRGTGNNGRYDNAFLDIKVSMAKPGAIYRISHVSKDNETWGSPITFFEIGRSYDNGATWKVINARGGVMESNNQTGIKTHIVNPNGHDEIFTIIIDWNGLATGSNNVGIYDYIIHPITYSFKHSSSSNPANDLEDDIVVRKNGRQVQIKQRLDDNRNFIVEYNSVGINNFNEFRAFYIQPNTAKDNDFSGTQVGQSGTDWISPYGMLAVNNPVSGSAGSITVGGSHGTTSGQGFPTGEFIQLSRCHVDGVEVTTTPLRGKRFELTSEHYVSASNVVNKTTGAKRNTAIERRIYDIYGNGNHNVTVEVEALEDIHMTRYAGFMMPMLSAFFTHFYLYDTGGEIGLFRSGGLPEGLADGIYHTENKDYQAIDRAVLVNDDMLLVMLTDRTFGIGTGEFAPTSTADKPQSPILYTGGQFGKISAHNLGGSSNEYLVKDGEKISYRGGYHFVDYTQPQENVFEYEINGVTQVDDLR